MCVYAKSLDDQMYQGRAGTVFVQFRVDRSKRDGSMTKQKSLVIFIRISEYKTRLFGALRFKFMFNSKILFYTITRYMYLKNTKTYLYMDKTQTTAKNTCIFVVIWVLLMLFICFM